MTTNDEMPTTPAGVPLTADNVADAVECRDSWGTHVRVGPNAWDVYGAGRNDDKALVFTAPAYGTVVTKWRK